MNNSKQLLPADLQKRINVDLESALAARKEGNEGKVRVSARRAVGWAIQAYYLKIGIALPSKSALAHIQYMIEDEDIEGKTAKALPHFVQRLEKDSLEGDSYWPLNIDLIEKAQQIIAQLSEKNH